MRVRKRPSVRALAPWADRAARGPTRSARLQRRNLPVPQCEKAQLEGGPHDERLQHDADPGVVRRDGVAATDAATLVAVQSAVRAGVVDQRGTAGRAVGDHRGHDRYADPPRAELVVVAGCRIYRRGRAVARVDRGARPVGAAGTVGGVADGLRPAGNAPVHPAGVVASATSGHLVAAGRAPHPQPRVRPGPAGEPAGRLRVPSRPRRGRAGAGAGVLPCRFRQQDARLPRVDLPPGRPGLGVRQRRPSAVPCQLP